MCDGFSRNLECLSTMFLSLGRVPIMPFHRWTQEAIFEIIMMMII